MNGTRIAAALVLLLLLLCGCGAPAQTTGEDPQAAMETEPPTETPVPPTPNEALTALITENFSNNFDEADWYPFIDSLTVYDSPQEDRFLEIVFRLDEPAAQKYVRTVVDSAYGNYVYASNWREQGIQKVVGVDNRSGKAFYSRDHLG